MAMKLTKRAVDSFRYEGRDGQRDVRWDSEIAGFGVRIYPPDADGRSRRSFVVSYRANGRKRMMVVGRYGVLTVDEARERARKHLAAVTDGLDPLEERRKVRARVTFGELITRYMEGYAKVHKRTWKADESRLNRHIPARWKSRMAEDITGEDIAKLHREIGIDRKKPYEANRLIEILRKIYNLAKVPGWRLVTANHENPTAGIAKHRERKRTRWLRPEEVKPLAAAIQTEPNIYVRAAIWLYLLTGLRKTELLTAKRDEIDWHRALLRLPETKAGEEQQAPLNKAAMAIIQAIPVMEGNSYLLPGSRKGHHLVGIDKPWSRIRKAAGVEDLHLHDLRRTVGSWLTQDRVDLNTIKDALRHASIDTTLTYARLGADPARKAIEKHGKRLLKVAGSDAPQLVASDEK